MSTLPSSHPRRHAAQVVGAASDRRATTGRRGPSAVRLLVVAVVILTAGIVLLAGYAARLPDPRGMRAQVQVMLGAHGGRYVALRDVPRALRLAIVATEDDSFYSNPGISLEALGRAMIHNVQLHSMAEGGSTISQQLAKVVYLDGSDRTARRKVADMVLALRMNRQLSKDQILELYLNAIYYGHGAYGLAQAATIYFHRPVARLDLAQCALLAGLPRAPSLLDPYVYPLRARNRRATVLSQMTRLHLISPAQAAAAAREGLVS